MAAARQQIHVRHDPEARQFQAQLDGHTAFLEYAMADGNFVLTHTEVPDAMQGKRVGEQLVEAALQYARDNHLPVVPLCPYVFAYLKRHKNWLDVVHPKYKLVVSKG